DKIFHLQIDDPAFVVGGETEVASIAENAFVLREAVADLGCSAAVDIRSIEHRENHVTLVDQALVLTANLRIDFSPAIPALCPDGKSHPRSNISLASPRVQELMTQFSQYRKEALLVKGAPRL